MRTRKHSSPMEAVWVDKQVYDEAERLHYEGMAEHLVAEQLQEGKLACLVDSDLPSENGLKDDPRQTKNGKKQKRRHRSLKSKSSSSRLDCVLKGLALEHVWFDKYLYEDAESEYQAKLAADMAEALKNTQWSVQHTAPGPSLAVSPWKIRVDEQTAVNCIHGRSVACHHVVCDAWVNKASFDAAETSFVEIFSSMLVQRPPELPLALDQTVHNCPAHHTPDEGYVTGAATPATPSLPAVHLISPRVHAVVSADETVNGKPHLSGLRELMAEVWLEKPLYDDAERCFYETMLSAGNPPPLQEPREGYKPESAKKGKKALKVVRKSKIGVEKVTLSEGARLTSPCHYFVHSDSERVWLDRSLYNQAESRYHMAQAQDLVNYYAKDHQVELTPVSPSQPPAFPSADQGFSLKKMAAESLLQDQTWFDKSKYDDAERQYYEQLSRPASVSQCQKSPVSQCQKSPGTQCPEEDGASTILRDIARARENIQKSLAGLKTVLRNPPEAQPACSPSQSVPHTSAAAPAGPAGETSELVARVANLELENQSLHKVVEDLQLAISKLEVRLTTLEKSPISHPPSAAQPAAAPIANGQPSTQVKKVEVTTAPEEDDDDIDLFGSDDEEDEEAELLREERLRQYAEKKSKKPSIIAKSSILLDVKPWDDETDMAKLEECVRTVQMDGLLWGSSKLVPVGYGIRKLQIQCVVEDDKVGTDILEEEITKFEDYVQSVDIAAFNKI